MHRNRWLLFVLIAFCVLSGIAAAQPPDSKNFVTHLSGDEEVPPVDTSAQGQAVFHFWDTDNELLYKLIVVNIEGVIQAHIHCGAEGANGPVVAFLFGPVAGGLDANGVLAQGALTNVTNPACGETLSDLVQSMRDGNTYVNVHTVAHPGGEIRGQIRTAGPDSGG